MSKTATAQTRDLAHSALNGVGSLSSHAMEVAQDSVHALRSRAARAGEQTVDYIREEPVKSVVAAAAVGAVAALLLGWLGRSRLR
ncbi:hypothetical protein [Hydrogenophaga sp.]|uniref:hypothetical protein n=1 Tax=Hydrogenophaga sp. TaxID=1904254 RepID=UPI00261C0383|nr:hypothetical protein [Hydrogenophaga sp.]MCW5655514.1 hypothetical protein [Hydrogenophaga sp.]